MDLEQRLRASLVAPKPRAMFTARVLARIARGDSRRRGRFILLGTVLVVGAAAAMLAWRVSVMQPLTMGTATIPAVRDSGAVAGDPAGTSVPEVTAPSASASATEPVPETASARYSVLVMALRQDTQNVAGRVPVEALYASMLGELRKVPGLTLRMEGEAERGTGGAPDYVLSLTSLATAVSKSGGVLLRSTDGTMKCAENGGSEMFCGSSPIPELPGGAKRLRGMRVDTVYGATEYGGEGITRFSTGASYDSESIVWVELKVEPRQSAASRFTLPVGVNREDERTRCGDQAGVRSPDCMTPAQLAASQVETLRLLVFPADAAFQQRLLARLGSASQDQAGTLALSDLLLGLARYGSRLDTGTLHALTRYLASQAANTRATAWNTLSRVSHPALAAALVESLRHDTDQSVRLAALANLAANYSADPLVRRALEDIDREDKDVIVRATVRRALYGPVQWRDDVLAALRDTELTYEARLAPLIANTTAGPPEQEAQQFLSRRAVLQEQQVLRPLVALVREHLRDSAHAQATGNALGVLASVDDPAVFDLFLQLMRETSLPLPISSAIGNWAINHQNDPRVREGMALVEPAVIPSQLLERMRQVTGGSAQDEGSVIHGSGAIRRAPPPAQ